MGHNAAQARCGDAPSPPSVCDASDFGAAVPLVVGKDP